MGRDMYIDISRMSSVYASIWLVLCVQAVYMYTTLSTLHTCTNRHACMSEGYSLLMRANHQGSLNTCYLYLKVSISCIETTLHLFVQLHCLLFRGFPLVAAEQREREGGEVDAT